MITCKFCGKESIRSYSGYCQGCYKYFNNGGKIYDLPEPGRIEHTGDGKVICHICGKAFIRLGSHVKENHNMTIKDYKERFGLCRRAKTTEVNYSKKMSYSALKNNMDEQLRVCGAATRLKKGSNHFHTKENGIRLQEILEKRDRKRGAI